MNLFFIHNFWEFFIFSCILLGTPGPAIISLVASGVQFGFLRSLPFFLGIISGWFLNILFTSLGLGAILAISPTIYFGFKILGLLYILYLAYKLITSSVIKEKKEKKPLHFLQGILLNLLNPKAYIISLSVMTQFANTKHYVLSVIWIIVLNVVIAFVLQGGWTYLGSTLVKVFKNQKWARIINIILALLMVGSVVIAFFL